MATHIKKASAVLHSIYAHALKTLVFMTTCFMLVSCATTDQPHQEPLLNTYWKLIELEGNSVTTLASQPREAYLQFRPENKLKGHTGCNALFGSYQREDNQLSFGHIGNTRMSCFNKTGENEVALLKLLSTPMMWQIKGNQLELLDDQNIVVARFKAVYF